MEMLTESQIKDRIDTLRNTNADDKVSENALFDLIHDALCKLTYLCITPSACSCSNKEIGD